MLMASAMSYLDIRVLQELCPVRSSEYSSCPSVFILSMLHQGHPDLQVMTPLSLSTSLLQYVLFLRYSLEAQ